MNPEENSRSNRYLFFTAIAGVSYLIAGSLQVIASFIPDSILLIPPNPIGGVILICVSLVFLTGVSHYARRRSDAYAFLIVGMILAGIIFVLLLITISTNLLGWILVFEDWENWRIQDELSPALWLFPIYALLLQLIKEKGESLFDMKLVNGGET